MTLKTRIILLVIFVAVFLSSCASHYIGATSADPYGFASGIWHGICFPFALVGMFVSWISGFFGIEILTSVKLVGRPNTGVYFYYIGYAIGVYTVLSAR